MGRNSYLKALIEEEEIESVRNHMEDNKKI